MSNFSANLANPGGETRETLQQWLRRQVAARQAASMSGKGGADTLAGGVSVGRDQPIFGSGMPKNLGPAYGAGPGQSPIPKADSVTYDAAPRDMRGAGPVPSNITPKARPFPGMNPHGAAANRVARPTGNAPEALFGSEDPQVPPGAGSRSGGLLSRLGGGLPDDFGDRASALLGGWAQGETMAELNAPRRLGAASLSDYRKESRKERKEAAELNRTREYAVRAGLPADVAQVMSASDLSSFIEQDWQKRREQETANSQSNRTAQFLVEQGIMTPQQAQMATPDMLKTALDIYQSKRTKGPQVLSQGQRAFDEGSGKLLFENPAAPQKPDGQTLVSPDGKTTRSFDVSTQEGAYAFRKYLGLGWTERASGGVNVNLGQAPTKSVFDAMAERTNEATAAARSLPAFATARKSLADGTITGFGADQRLFLAKLGTLMGMPNEAVANTETFRASMAPTVLALVKGLGAGTAISNADREFAEKAVGGTIVLDAGSITRLVDIGERASRERLNQHRATLDKVYPDTPENAQARALFNVQIPEMPAMGQSDVSIDDLIKERERRQRQRQAQPFGGR